MLLVEGFDRIYQIGHAYREGELGIWHNPEFTLLEWYRVGADYLDLMDETSELIAGIVSLGKSAFKLPPRRIALSEIFLERAGWDPAAQWDEERFFRDLVEKIEPSLESDSAVFLFDYPAPVAAMAKIKDDDQKRCERFELYLRGVEIANGYTELQDAAEQRQRFIAENEKRRKMNKPVYPIDEKFLGALRCGLPSCAGIALGVDRLVACLLDETGIAPVIAFKESPAEN